MAEEERCCCCLRAVEDDVDLSFLDGGRCLASNGAFRFPGLDDLVVALVVVAGFCRAGRSSSLACLGLELLVTAMFRIYSPNMARLCFG